VMVKHEEGLILDFTLTCLSDGELLILGEILSRRN
jgi:hypothetical protein